MSKRQRHGTATFSGASKTKPVSNVFEDIGFSPEESRVETLKAELYVQILRTVRERGLSQKELCRRWGKPQSRVSEVLNGKLNLVSIDTLVTYLTQLDATVRLTVDLCEAG